MFDELNRDLRFAAITGWRIASEVLPLEWRQVDMTAGEVTLGNLRRRRRLRLYHHVGENHRVRLGGIVRADEQSDQHGVLK